MERKFNPSWYKLTKLLIRKGKIGTGLTIPYIFGAYQLLEKPLVDISAVIDELRKYPIDKYPVIQKCDVIHQHVVAVEHQRIYHDNLVRDVKLRNEKGEIDLVISSNTELGKTEKEVYKNLTQLYSQFIQKGTFSWDNAAGEWKPFSSEELELIRSIK